MRNVILQCGAVHVQFSLQLLNLGVKSLYGLVLFHFELKDVWIQKKDWALSSCPDNGREDGCPGEGRRYHFLRGKERRERSEQLSSDRFKNGRGKSASSHAKRVHCSSGVWSVSGGGGCWWDRRHENLIVLRNNRVIGGITYRLFEDRNFVEIVFCTVATDEQIHVESNGSIQS